MPQTTPSRKFATRDGRSWIIDVNVMTIRQCRLYSGVDLYETAKLGLMALSDLLGKPDQLVDVVYGLVKEQADAQGITTVDFARSLDGEALESAAQATIEGIIDFFPDRAVREALRRAFKRSIETTAQQTQTIALALNRVTNVTLANVLGLTSSSIDSPATSASIPAG